MENNSDNTPDTTPEDTHHLAQEASGRCLSMAYDEAHRMWWLRTPGDKNDHAALYLTIDYLDYTSLGQRVEGVGRDLDDWVRSRFWLILFTFPFDNHKRRCTAADSNNRRYYPDNQACV